MSINGLPAEIKNKKLIVVEGDQDCQFFAKLIDKLDIKGVYVLGIGGKGNFNDDLQRLHRRPGFSSLTHFAVIRDKDEDNAFESIVKILQDKDKMNISPVPSAPGVFTTGKPKTGVFIMPGSIQGKMLEDLCLKSVEDKPEMKCVNDFANCVSRLESPPKNPSKSKVLAFLASQPEDANTVGQGAEKNYWNLDAPCLNELKTFLNNLR